MALFVGEFDQTLDDKRRLAIPAALREQIERKLEELMTRRRDELVPCTSYGNWFDSYRRVVRNVYGPLGDPEDEPDWSLLS